MIGTDGPLMAEYFLEDLQLKLLQEYAILVEYLPFPLFVPE
jgi:hypothetical protein